MSRTKEAMMRLDDAFPLIVEHAEPVTFNYSGHFTDDDDNYAVYGDTLEKVLYHIKLLFTLKGKFIQKFLHAGEPGSSSYEILFENNTRKPITVHHSTKHIY